MRFKVNTGLCSGHARCVAVAPHVFVLNDDGYNETPEGEVAPGLEDKPAAARAPVPNGPSPSARTEPG